MCILLFYFQARGIKNQLHLTACLHNSENNFIVKMRVQFAIKIKHKQLTLRVRYVYNTNLKNYVKLVRYAVDV